MIFGAVLLPLIREDQPPSIDETDNTSLNKLIAMIFRTQHVVPTVNGWPNVALGLPLGEWDWVHTYLHTCYTSRRLCVLVSFIWDQTEI